MAVFTNDGGSAPTNQKRAVVLAPENAASHLLALDNRYPADVSQPYPSGMVSYGAVLDPRYVKGGATTWERPAQSG